MSAALEQQTFPVAAIDPLLACSLIASGLRLKDAAKQMGVTIQQLWQVLNLPENKDAYAHAREIKAHGIADDIDSTTGKVEAGDLAPDAARVILDGKKWLAARLDQKRWGDRTTTDVNLTVIVDALANRLTSGRQQVTGRTVQGELTDITKHERVTGNMLNHTDCTLSEVPSTDIDRNKP